MSVFTHRAEYWEQLNFKSAWQQLKKVLICTMLHLYYSLKV